MSKVDHKKLSLLENPRYTGYHHLRGVEMLKCLKRSKTRVARTSRHWNEVVHQIKTGSPPKIGRKGGTGEEVNVKEMFLSLAFNADY